MTDIANRPEVAVAPGVNAGDGTTPLDTNLLERVIQRIFTACLLLGTATNGETGRGAASIERAIAELDEALRDIRGEVFRDSVHID